MSRPEPPRRRTFRLWWRALHEFAAVPLLVIAGFCLLAVLSILADQEHLAGLDTARRVVGRVIGKNAASSTLQAIAGGLVTVTSITFSVLLLAVQQTASSLSPVVFDQWVRRKTNQVFLGFFVGLAIFAYVVMAAVRDGTPPTLGAGIATCMTVAAMLFLLVLVYTTIDQMRPESVLRLIHDRTLRARRRQGGLVQRTRRQAQSDDPVQATYRATTSGYVNGIDLDHLEPALRDERAEVELHVSLGHFVAFGDLIATVRSADRDVAREAAECLHEALLVDRRRDLDHDATTGIDQLANIGWTNGSSSRQNPEVAREALDALKDIAARLFSSDPALDTDGGRPLPVVYPDDDANRILDVLFSMLVAAHEAEQHLLAARVLLVYRDLLEQAPDAIRERLHSDVAAATALLDDIPLSPVLARARAALEFRADGDFASASSRSGGR